MDSNITIKIVEPGSGPVVPNTGLFTNGVGGPETAIITISAVIILVAIIAAVLYYRKKKQGKVDSLSALLKTSFKHKKATTLGLTALALLVSVGTLATLIKTGVQAVNLEEQDTSEETESLATVEDGELVVELGDTPVFAYIPTTITVEEEMPAGYTLKAYSANPTLSSEGTDKTISLVTIPEDGYENAGSLTTSLTDNTWGLATEEPESYTQQIYYSLPQSQEDAIVIKSIDDYSPTPAGDTTTVYYGVYITPDMPYGTYTGATVSYEVQENVATVVFDGNGLYFNDDEVQSTNTANYIIETTEDTEKYSHTPNVTDDGSSEKQVAYNTITNDVVEVPGAASLHIKLKYGTYDNTWDYVSFWQGSHPEYTAQNDYDKAVTECGGTTTDGRFAGNYDNPVTVECDIPGDSVTFGFWTQPAGGPPLGYGYYAIVTGYDADGNIIYLQGNKLVSGEYLIPDTTISHRFFGWDTDPEATTATYPNETAIAKELPLTIGETTTLYAIWESAFVISYNGNGADSTSNMDNVEQYSADITSDSKQVDLISSNFTKDGYGFVGWSTDQNAWNDLTDDDEGNDPVIYGPNQTITVDPSDTNGLKLYAVWAPAETDNSGNPITLQDWQGCSNLTATTYDSQTGTLTVGKNTVTALTDSRDGNIYTVARLADGNCWMTENLRLDNEPELSSTNTNNPSLPLTNNYEEQTTSNFLSATSDDWCTDYDSAPCYNQSKLNTNNTALTTTSPSFSQDFTNQAHKDFNSNISSYSNYYNWYSATAGNGKQETTTTVSGDICPAGWSLPIGNQTSANGSFSNLDSNMGGTGSSQYTTEASNNWRSFPNNFVYSGYWRGSSASYRGSIGNYWSSTAGYTGSAYGLIFGSGNVLPGTGGSNKSNGNSVRCVAPVQ